MALNNFHRVLVVAAILAMFVLGLCGIARGGATLFLLGLLSAAGAVIAVARQIHVNNIRMPDSKTGAHR